LTDVLVAGEPVHAVDVLDGNPEPGGGVVQIHADDRTGRRTLVVGAGHSAGNTLL
jgi:hypothetical protein